MQLQNEWNLEKYKIAATLTDCLLFEYNFTTADAAVFHGNDTLLATGTIITNIKYDKDERLIKYIHPDDICKLSKMLDEIHAGTERHFLELRIKDSKEWYSWFEFNGLVFFTEDKKPIRLIGKLDNIDERKREVERFKSKSEKDELTSLFNRSTSEKRINRMICSEEFEDDGVLLLIDFDNFSKINERMGQLFGDSILRRVAGTLKRAFRSTDVIGRVGQDEFVVFLIGKNIQNLIGEKVLALQEMFQNIYSPYDGEAHISCSVGIAFVPGHGKNYRELFKSADFALYQAKKRGKNRYHIYNENDLDVNLLFSDELLNSYELNEKSHATDKRNVDVTVTKILELLFAAKDIHNAINLILEMIGERYKVCSVYICELDELKHLNATYEWNRGGKQCKKNKIQDIPSELVDYYVELFNADGVFYCSNTEELKEAHPAVYSIFNGQEVKSTLQCYILDMGEFKGFVGFDELNTSRLWTKAEIEALTIIAKIVGTYITQLRTRERLDEERVMLKEISKNQNIFSYILKPNSFELIYMDDNTKELFPEAEVGELCYRVFMGLKEPCIECPLYQLDEAKRSNFLYIYNAKKDLRLKVTAAAIYWGKRAGNLICASEVTDFVQMLKDKDDFTGLPTLGKFERELDERLMNADKKNAVVTIDIDKFKNVNENLGYMVGNDVLKSFVNEVNGELSADEIFCRSSADKFLLLLDFKGYEETYERLSGLIDVVSGNLNELYDEIHIVLAAGLYITNEYDTSASKVIDKADIARKSIKGAHKSMFANYDDKIHQRVVQEKEVESRMHLALTNEEFVVFLQPKIDLRTKKIVGAEALVRWLTKDHLLIAPNEFIPIFERNGFVNQLDFYVYNRVFHKLRKWMNEGKEVIPISVNISRVHLEDRQFVKKMKDLSRIYNIPAGMIELEITESVFFDETNTLIKVIDALKNFGYILSIDDFGSGYSSLNLLRHLQIDVLKLDKGFFDKELITDKERIVLTNIIRMSKELGMKVLSEGVETIEQVNYLTEINCDMAQGYYFAKPMPMEQFEKLMWSESCSYQND